MSQRNALDIWSKYQQISEFDETDPILKNFFLKYQREYFLIKDIPRRSRVLDIGCGNGLFLAKLKQKRGCEVHGIDILPEAISIAKKHGVNARVGNAEELPYPDGYFDVICSFGLFEHWKNPKNLLEEWSRVLKGGGLHICSVPNRYGYFGISNLQKKIYEKRHGEWKFGYEKRYSASLLKDVFIDGGYSIEKVYTVQITPPFLTNTGLARYPKHIKKFSIRCYSKIEDLMMHLPFGYHLTIITKRK